ncbi:unnamed protein product [Rotaria sordida]|uniref:Protein kinase domain-containing protein n=1 Tax=Rotaria sordida TaxID=392033 RepID=A0A819VID7_9BILA|nr:unnamed protein product [Rotaria sordida]CAF4110045.1 unnamed protein product [Rotaria sordida]
MQMINFVRYLYITNLIHRDIRPPNVMIGPNKMLRLIDFGFAYRFKANETVQNLPIEGTTTFAGIDFLTEYLNLIEDPHGTVWYNYERNFDLFCAINVITYMINKEVRYEMNKIHGAITCGNTKEYDALQIWIRMQQQNKTYDELLQSIRKLSNVLDFENIESILRKNSKNLQMISNPNYIN